jgi:hypothetical protein
LSTTIEKRLMIDVMILRQFYERREITDVIWIHGINNSVDSMIKIKSSTALKTMININQINLDITEWVKRTTVNQSKRTKQEEWEISEKWIKEMCFHFQRNSSVSTYHVLILLHHM